jgi:predicted enzyme related to lactoylglutathione lyase
VTAVSNTPTNAYETGRFVWHDLVTYDVAGARAFYGALFGWQFEDAPGGDGAYTTILHKGKPIGGIVALEKVKGQVDSQWLSYLSVPDVDHSTDAAVERRAVVYRKPFDLPDRGRISLLVDNRKAAVGFLHATGGDPAFGDPIYDEWLWHELWTDQVDESMSFYEALFDYQRDTIKLGSYDYGVLQKEGKLRGGVVQIAIDGVIPNWLPYIAVPDPSAVVTRVDELGGKVILTSQATATGKNRAAIITDPSGAAFGVHIWPLPKEVRREGAE